MYLLDAKRIARATACTIGVFIYSVVCLGLMSTEYYTYVRYASITLFIITIGYLFVLKKRLDLIRTAYLASPDEKSECQHLESTIALLKLICFGFIIWAIV